MTGEGGERRLNVLISRARKRCHVFAPIIGDDIDLERALGRRVASFRTFLSYAPTGRLSVAVVSGNVDDSPRLRNTFGARSRVWAASRQPPQPAMRMEKTLTVNPLGCFMHGGACGFGNWFARFGYGNPKKMFCRAQNHRFVTIYFLIVSHYSDLIGPISWGFRYATFNCVLRFNYRGLIFLTVSIFLFSHPLSLVAAKVSWVGGSGDWNNANNWSIDALPGTNHDNMLNLGPSVPFLII